ncbi:MAG: hypothetical protein DM484_03180 [Candidatus Methylumidiphilus alinenensis]|uniref:Uncharacterized protein n=1 Tax=Candidatus Methylumidiphilus alinenensis TaxID=2202197 RepID=A0A2W4RJV8_9GAMM|nr:MAG: hypothetical protein DM484_03180 [Candidatus Methylumidiphilus alinenensis]
MKRTMVFALGLLFSASVLAGADHYIRKDGTHIQHLKITKQKGEVKVLLDVDFEPTGSETDKPCSTEISGEAKVVSENELHLKKQAQGEAHYCELKILLNGDEAKIEETQDCVRYFTGDFCRFDSEGKVLAKIK